MLPSRGCTTLKHRPQAHQAPLCLVGFALGQLCAPGVVKELCAVGGAGQLGLPLCDHRKIMQKVRRPTDGKGRFKLDPRQILAPLARPPPPVLEVLGGKVQILGGRL